MAARPSSLRYFPDTLEQRVRLMCCSPEHPAATAFTPASVTLSQPFSFTFFTSAPSTVASHASTSSSVALLSNVFSMLGASAALMPSFLGGALCPSSSS